MNPLGHTLFLTLRVHVSMLLLYFGTNQDLARVREEAMLVGRMAVTESYLTWTSLVLVDPSNIFGALYFRTSLGPRKQNAMYAIGLSVSDSVFAID